MPPRWEAHSIDSLPSGSTPANCWISRWISEKTFNGRHASHRIKSLPNVASGNRRYQFDRHNIDWLQLTCAGVRESNDPEVVAWNLPKKTQNPSGGLGWGRIRSGSGLRDRLFGKAVSALSWRRLSSGWRDKIHHTSSFWRLSNAWSHFFFKQVQEESFFKLVV